MTSPFKELRQALVDYLIDQGFLISPEVINAMREVPRHLFVKADPFAAYSDIALRIKESGSVTTSTISQPSVVAHMLEELNVHPGLAVLEIGTGLGYNAALLSTLVGPSGKVITVEFDRELAKSAADRLGAYANVKVLAADGRCGYGEGAPFQRIVATVTATEIYPEWQKQLDIGGVLLIPLEYGLGHTRLLKLKRTGTGFEGRFGWPVNFVPMAGREPAGRKATRERSFPWSDGTGLNARYKDALLLYSWVTGQNQKQWEDLGRPMPEDYIVSTSSGLFSLASLQLNIST